MFPFCLVGVEIAAVRNDYYVLGKYWQSTVLRGAAGGIISMFYMLKNINANKARAPRLQEMSIDREIGRNPGARRAEILSAASNFRRRTSGYVGCFRYFAFLLPTDHAQLHNTKRPENKNLKKYKNCLHSDWFLITLTRNCHHELIKKSIGDVRWVTCGQVWTSRRIDKIIANPRSPIKRDFWRDNWWRRACSPSWLDKTAPKSYRAHRIVTANAIIEFCAVIVIIVQ